MQKYPRRNPTPKAKRPKEQVKPKKKNAFDVGIAVTSSASDMELLVNDNAPDFVQGFHLLFEDSSVGKINDILKQFVDPPAIYTGTKNIYLDFSNIAYLDHDAVVTFLSRFFRQLSLLVGHKPTHISIHCPYIFDLIITLPRISRNFNIHPYLITESNQPLGKIVADTLVLGFGHVVLWSAKVLSSTRTIDGFSTVPFEIDPFFTDTTEMVLADLRTGNIKFAQVKQKLPQTAMWLVKTPFGEVVANEGDTILGTSKNQLLVFKP